LRRSCGAAPQARKDSRQEPRCSRRVVGFSAGWACPQPPTPHPIRPIGPGLPQKAGVSLLAARHGLKAFPRAERRVSFLTRFVARSDCTASHSLNSAAVLLGCRKCTALLLIVGKVASFLSAFLDLVKMRVGATTLHPPSCYVGVCLRNGARPNRGSRFGLYGLGPSALRTARDKGV
jgi:hypothetical protein